MLRIALIAAVLVACTDDASSPTDGSSEQLPGITPFGGTSATLPPDDLAPLDALIGDAQFIGLGESVHTSGGFYAFKRRMIEHLVRDRGIRVLAFESWRSPAQVLDRYLQVCDRPARDVLETSLFQEYADDHMLALVEFLCAFNLAHPDDPVRVFGFDMQQPEHDVVELGAFLERAAPADAPHLLSGISACQRSQEAINAPYPAQELEACTAGLGVIDEYLANHGAELKAVTDPTSVRFAEIAAMSFRAWQLMSSAMWTDLSLAFSVRDLAMHRIFAALRDVEFPGQRGIIWAHNYHLMTNHRALPAGPAAATTFGSELRDEIGDAYVAIALAGYDVEINWPEFGVGPIEPAVARSLVVELRALAQPYLIVDPSAPLVGTDARPIRDPESYGDGELVLGNHYDAMVYVEKSPPMEALFW